MLAHLDTKMKLYTAIGCLIVFMSCGDGSGSEIHFGTCVLVTHSVCPDTNSVRIYLYTRSNPDDSDAQYVYFNASSDNMTASYFDAKRPNKLIIHGYNADMLIDSLMQIKTAYLKQGDYNVWMVNWPNLCRGPCYPFAVYNLGHVGHCLSQLVLALRRRVVHLDLHVIGFSLGAHVCNYLALNLAPYTIPRVTGLDPAMLLFIGRSKDRKLDKSDALFVDVIHTNSLIQGNVEETGHVDFYVNGGITQPGCRNVTQPFACDHNRAPEYFAESITTDIGFISWPCSGVVEFFMGKCKPKPDPVPMGEACPYTTRGVYATYTADREPFALGPWTGARFKAFNTTTSAQHDTPPTVQMVN